MRYTRKNLKKIMINNSYSNLLNKISFQQLISLSLAALLTHFTYRSNEIISSLLISAATSFLYTQLIKIGIYNKFFGLFGFPLRLLILTPPCAILVHKLHSNLIALFLGFLICQLIYIGNIWYNIKSMSNN